MVERTCTSGGSASFSLNLNSGDNFFTTEAQRAQRQCLETGGTLTVVHFRVSPTLGGRRGGLAGRDGRLARPSADRFLARLNQLGARRYPNLACPGIPPRLARQDRRASTCALPTDERAARPYPGERNPERHLTLTDIPCMHVRAEDAVQSQAIEQKLTKATKANRSRGVFVAFVPLVYLLFKFQGSGSLNPCHQQLNVPGASFGCDCGALGPLCRRSIAFSRLEQNRRRQKRVRVQNRELNWNVNVRGGDQVRPPEE